MTKHKKFKGLSPNCHYSHAKEYVDIDYADKLSDEDAEWFSNFLDNYYKGRYKVDDKKNPIKDRRETWNRGYSRKVDFMSGRFKSRLDFGDVEGEGNPELDAASLELWEEKERKDE